MIGAFIPWRDGGRAATGYIVCENGCWEWCGHVERTGYGQVPLWDPRVGRFRKHRAHRAVYEKMVGLIPAGLTLDHLCRNRRCVRPDHLEPVTIQENTRRGFSPPALNRRKTHCKRGHPLGAENSRGKRPCSKCEKVYTAERLERGQRAQYLARKKQSAEWVVRERDRQRESKRRSRAARRSAPTLPAAATAALLATGEGE